MESSYVATGQLDEQGIITLDEPLPLPAMKVRVRIEPIGEKSKKRPVMEVMEEIWEGQRARGHVPRTREEIDEYL